jgi:hypothetical protein
LQKIVALAPARAYFQILLPAEKGSLEDIMIFQPKATDFVCGLCVLQFGRATQSPSGSVPLGI